MGEHSLPTVVRETRVCARYAAVGGVVQQCGKVQGAPRPCRLRMKAERQGHAQGTGGEGPDENVPM